MTDMLIERRRVPLEGVEVREEDGATKFRGHAAVFNRMTDLGKFREKVAPGAFTKTLQEANVALLFNHDDSSVMATTKGGGLRLAEDRTGLATDADMDPTDPDVQRVVSKMRRGDLDQMSFGFRATQQSWEDHPEDGGPPIRTLREVQLFDVSVVTFPAYPQTDAAIGRSVEKVYERRMRELEIEPEERQDSSGWDGDRAMGMCNTAADYRSVCAGEKSVGDPDERQHWALPHHYLGREFNVGGVQNARARFAQTQGLSNAAAARAHLFETHRLPSDEGRSIDELIAEAIEPHEHEDGPGRDEHPPAEGRALRVKRNEKRIAELKYLAGLK